jgi:cellulose synthase/poly-beta-1,6-N-acetylglucosamine synthase-like glycosyltransferase
MDNALLLIYTVIVWLLFAYNLGQLSLIVRYIISLRARKLISSDGETAFSEAWPMVTVQLPIYNERYVVERLIDAVAALNYPADKLQIQVLDDSTDDSINLIASRVSHYLCQNIHIEHIRRGQRTGYKAGALAHGLTTATGEFIAIFDADFVPDPDFLRNTIPTFSDPAIGAVQTRWTYFNRRYSWLTQMQGFGLDAHFGLEQRARSATGLLLNFNGTGGIWRKTTILDAGGWRSHTLTEDLDLSYRAQLRGWRLVYRDDIASPGELPVTMAALRSQQHRWMKGAAECVRTLALPLLTARRVSLSAKVHGLLHLLSSTMFALLLALSVLSVPVLVVWHRQPAGLFGFDAGGLFSINLLIMGLLHGIPYWRHGAESRPGEPVWRAGLRFVGLFFLYPSLMLGLSLHNTGAVAGGYLGRQTPFVRTPKFDLNANGGGWQTSSYHRQSLPRIVWPEAGLLVYFGLGIGLGFAWHEYRLLPLHILNVVGYGLVVGYSLRQTGPGGWLRRGQVVGEQPVFSGSVASGPRQAAPVADGGL